MIWKHEALDFTSWLAEEDKMTILGDTIGINLGWRELPDKKASRIIIEKKVNLKDKSS